MAVGVYSVGHLQYPQTTLLLYSISANKRKQNHLFISFKAGFSFLIQFFAVAEGKKPGKRDEKSFKSYNVLLFAP